MKKLLFKIQEATWWFVAELEDVLYPYRDREITHPLWAENSNSINVEELCCCHGASDSQSQQNSCYIDQFVLSSV